MKRHKSPTPPAGKLRPQAEKRLKEKGLPDTNDLSRTDARALVHELQVHQVELEMQNEELHRAQAEAQEAQQKFTELFDFAPAGYFLVDQNGLIREANLAGAALLGWDRSRLSGQPFAKLIAPDCRPHFAAFWSHLRETDTKQSCELTLLKEGQGVRSVVLEATVRSGLPGGGMRVLLGATDITERKHAEEALRTSHQALERRVEERTAELQQSNVRLGREIEERKRAEEEVAKQLHFETLIADISSKFVNLPPGEVDRELMDAERRICELLGSDGSALWQLSDQAPGMFTLTHLYSAKEGPQPPGRLSQEDFPWVRQQILAGRVLTLSSMDELPAEAARDRESALRFGIKSNLTIPLSVGGAPPIGALCLNTTWAERDWPDALVQRLQLVAQIFANALARKRADHALRESEELNRVTFEQAAVGIAHVGTDGRWLRVNDKLCAIVGYSREELMQLTFQDITHPEDLQTDLNFVRQVLSGEIQTYSMEKRYFRKDRSLIWVILTVSLVRSAAGAPLHFISVVEDITERKRGEEALRLSEARLAAGVDITGLGFVEVDEGTGTVFADDRLRELIGVPPDWEQGMRIVEFWKEHLHPDDVPRVLRERQEALDGKREDLSIEYRYLHPARGERWIQHIGRPTTRDATGFAVKSFSVLRDITERKRAAMEAQVLRSNLAHVARVSTLGEMAASVAHELNQPLGAILANAEAAELFLQQDPPALDDLRAILADIRKDDERAGEVIRRMRALLRKRDLEREPLEINSLVEDVLQFVSGDAALRGVSLTAELGPVLPKVAGDRVHLQQVLLNLILNGMDAMAGQPRERRQISVRTRLGGEGLVELAVIDSGCGIPLDKLPRLFEPFYTTKANGMGMGLSIARTIIEAHHGRIWAENNAAGGAVFRIALPTAGGGASHQ